MILPAKSLRTSAIALSAATLFGCATITGGTHEAVSIRSKPSGATVHIDGAAAYTTPTSVSLSRDKNHTITVTKHGYLPATLTLTRKFRTLPTIGGNILWLLPGVVVDGFSGGMWKFDRNHVDVILEKKPKTTATTAAK